MLPSLEIATGASPTATILWLHGLGADGYDFAPVVEQMQPLSHIRFVLPHAPSMAVTLNGGYVMPAWYDLYGRDLTAGEDEAGIRASQAMIEELIAAEIARGIRPERIALAGFSQGGAVALHTGLRCRHKLAGIIALSTYLPLADKLATEAAAPASQATPILMVHGLWDDIIPLTTGVASRDRLTSLGYMVAWQEYAMGHSVSPEEIADIRRFILEILPRG